MKDGHKAELGECAIDKANVVRAVKSAHDAGLIVVGIVVRQNGSFELTAELSPELSAEIKGVVKAPDHTRCRHDRVYHDPGIDLALANAATASGKLRTEAGKRTLTAEKVSELLELPLSTINRAAANGQLESSCAGNVLRFTPNSLERSMKGAQRRVERRLRESHSQTF